MFDFLVIYCHLVKDLHWDEKYLLKRLAFFFKVYNNGVELLEFFYHCKIICYVQIRIK